MNGCEHIKSGDIIEYIGDGVLHGPFVVLKNNALSEIVTIEKFPHYIGWEEIEFCIFLNEVGNVI